MATNIIKRTMPNGRQIMIKFGYADNNGEYYTRFADASYQNFDRGATYAAFVSHSHPDSLPCWEMDEEYGFEDRALTAEEKKWFEKNYFQTHPSKEAFDFMVDVQDELKRRCKDTDATVDGFDEGCEIAIMSERDKQEVCVYISFSEGGCITVMGCYNNYDIGQTTLDWSDTKKVIDEAWAAFSGLSLYRDFIHLPRIKGEYSSREELMKHARAEFDGRMHDMLKASFREYVKYLRNLTGDRNYFLQIEWLYKQDWREKWQQFFEEKTSELNIDYFRGRAMTWEALAYYHYESYNGRFMCNDTVVKYMLPKFAVDNLVIYSTSSACAPNTTTVKIYENMDVVNNPVHRIGEKICKLANEMKYEVSPNDIITLNWDIFGEDDAEFIKNNMPHITSYVYDYSRGISVIDGVHLSGEDTEIKRLDVASNGLVVYM